ncbi:MAG: ComF family protein [Muribaculaceae bacterium]|nr:ComF family protein [Muribaculaceae bacterium]
MSFLSDLSRAVQSLVDDYLLPRTCPVCGGPLSADDDAMCVKCLIEMPVCRERGVSLIDSRDVISNAAMPIALVEVLMMYDPTSKYAHLIRGAKYYDRPQLAYDMGKLFGQELLMRQYKADQITPRQIDVLLPMPMYRTKKFLRGYNQSEEIARGLAQVLGCAVGDNLVAVRPHKTQTRLSYSERAKNIKDSFSVRHAEELTGLNVAIVDDIITTGASMGEALMALSWSNAAVSTASLFSLGLTVRHG